MAEKTIEIVDILRGTNYARSVDEYNKSAISNSAKFLNLDNNKVLEKMIKFGNVYLDYTMEIRHGLIIGEPGTGKSVLTYSFTEQIIDRMNKLPTPEEKKKFKALIYDMKGDYIKLFYNPNRGDKIFNPVDKRSVRWNVVQDISKIAQGNQTRLQALVDNVGASLIPKAKNSQSNENFFLDGARNIFTTLLMFLYKYFPEKYHNNACFADLLKLGDRDMYTLISVLDKAKANLISPNTQGQAAGVLAELERHVRALHLVQYVQGDFSIPDWLEQGTGVLFVSGHTEIVETIRPILSLFIDLLSRNLLARPDDLTYRMFYILDEFCSLQELPTVIDILTRGRSKGGAMWLVTQDLGQISALYGEQQKQAIFNSSGTKVIFRLSSKEDAEYLSSVLGNMEVVIKTKQMSGSMGVSGDLDLDSVNVTYSYSIQNMPYAPPISLSSLKDLTFIMRSGAHPIVHGNLEFKPRKPISQTIDFIDRNPLDEAGVQTLLLSFREEVCSFLASFGINDPRAFSWFDSKTRNFISGASVYTTEPESNLEKFSSNSQYTKLQHISTKQLLADELETTTSFMDTIFEDPNATFLTNTDKKEEEK